MKLKGEKLAINRLERAKRLIKLALQSGRLLSDNIRRAGEVPAVRNITLYGAIVIIEAVITEQHRRLKLRETTDLWQQRLA